MSKLKTAVFAALVAVGMQIGVGVTANAQTDSGSQANLLDHETSQEQDKQLYEANPLSPGDAAPKLTMAPLGKSLPGKSLPGKSLPGKPIQLSSLYQDKPVVLLMGSCTCGMTKDNVPKLEAMYEKYAGRVHFAFLYMKDAHPSPAEIVEVDGKPLKLVQSKTMGHRVKLAKYLIHETGLTIPVYIDDMHGSGRKALAGFHNAAYVIDTDGKLVLAEQYKYKVENIEKALVQLVDSE